MPVGIGVPQWKDVPNFGLALTPQAYPDMVTRVILRLGSLLLRCWPQTAGGCGIGWSGRPRHRSLLLTIRRYEPWMSDCTLRQPRFGVAVARRTSHADTLATFATLTTLATRAIYALSPMLCGTNSR